MNLTQLRQHAKELVSFSLGLVDSAIGLVNSVYIFNLPNSKSCFWGLQITIIFRLANVETNFGLVNAGQLAIQASCNHSGKL